MTKTKFTPDRAKHILLAAVKKNNQAAHDAILEEFARLENRIRQLERMYDHIDLVHTEFLDNEAPNPPEVEI